MMNSAAKITLAALVRWLATNGEGEFRGVGTDALTEATTIPAKPVASLRLKTTLRIGLYKYLLSLANMPALIPISGAMPMLSMTRTPVYTDRVG
ncbi:hypothetical protein F5Y01DRAFT_293315 [Xylaria sp. FL0043]|nr:hypothetical protein F5Y01DRAFT_293315 [Xylaria sp. FL0043]